MTDNDNDPDRLHERFFNPEDISHWKNHSTEEFIGTILSDLYHQTQCIQMAVKSISTNGPFGNEIDFSGLDTELQSYLYDVLKHTGRIERVLKTVSAYISSKNEG